MVDAPVCDPAHILGTHVDNYEVISLIGSGSMGAVYEAKDLRDGSRVAIKVLLSDLSKESESAARLMREAKTMSLLSHPNIVAALDRGQLEDGRFFLVSELVRGVSLRALIDDGVIDQRRALFIVRQVLGALGHAHDHGVVHRDVKPENIMLADGGSPEGDSDLVKVLDFGVAKLVEDTLSVLGEGKLTQTGFNIFGSPLYTAPDALLGAPVDGRSDLYSVGVVLFELLTGKPIFTSPDPMAVLRLHATARIPTLAETAPDRSFTPQLEYVVTEALAKKPTMRFASAGEMIGAIDAAVISVDAADAATKKAGGTIVGLAPAISHRHTSEPASPHPMPSLARGRRLPNLLMGGSARRLDPRRTKLVVVGAFILVVIIATMRGRDGSARGGQTPLMGSSPIASKTVAQLSNLEQRANDLLTRSDANGANDLLERELAVDKEHDSGAAYLVLGHARLALGRRLDGLAAYERAIALDSALASDPQLKQNTLKVLDTRDATAAVVALEILATRVKPAARDSILAQASNGKVADVRHRAFAIAERDGIAEGVDRVESWSLDLKQATTCDERKTAVQRLRTTHDGRALATLQRVRGQFPCIEHDVNDAIAELQPSH